MAERCRSRRGEPWAACLQHEIDHLDGRLFVDYLSRLKQLRIRKRASKRTREAVA